MELKNLIAETISEYLNEVQILKNGYNLFYHGSTDKNLAGKNGIHVGTKLAATQALCARIGVPAEGEWNGKRIYGKTLLAGKKTLNRMNYVIGYDPIISFNATDDVPEDDYYPTQRKKRATYSDGKVIPFDLKPLVFQVIIIGDMSNTYDEPYSDAMANGIINRQITLKNAKQGYYYINTYEDAGSISAVVPNASFLKIV